MVRIRSNYYFFNDFFLLFARKSLGSLFSIEYIDFVPEVNDLLFYTYLVYHAIFLLDKKGSITILQFAICTYRNLVNLGLIRTKDFFKEKNRVNS